MAVYKDEEKGTWYAKFRYTDWTGKARSTTKRGFKTKREARAYEIDFKRKSSDMPDMTMEELCKRYLSAMKPRWKYSTYLSHECVIRLYILPMLGNLAISDISASTIVEWQNWMLSKKQSESTLNIRNGALTAILNYAVRLGWISKSPAANIRRIGAPTQRLEFWELDEYKKFLSAGEGSKNYEKYKLCFDILFFSGIRIGEFMGLGKGSFDFEKNQIIINQAIMQSTRTLSSPKTKQSFRRITMPTAIMERIKAYMDNLYEVPECKMFCATSRPIYERLTKWSKLAGIRPINVHGLRHSNASYLISLGIPITVISRRLGHKNPKITLDTYSHMYREDESNVADILAKALNVGQSVVKKNK